MIHNLKKLVNNVWRTGGGDNPKSGLGMMVVSSRVEQLQLERYPILCQKFPDHNKSVFFIFIFLQQNPHIFLL